MRRQIAASQFIVKRLRLFCHYLLESILVGLQEIVSILDNAIQSVFVKTNDSSEHVERIGSQAMLENSSFCSGFSWTHAEAWDFRA